MRYQSTALHWKKWPLFGLVLFMISLVVLMTSGFNENYVINEVNPYMTRETKIIVPKDDKSTETRQRKHGFQNPKRMGSKSKSAIAMKPDFPNPNRFDIKIPKGYKVWDEPEGISNPDGPGERGAPVMSLPEEKSQIEASYKEYGFNQYVSDKISFYRSVPDIRPIRYSLITIS